MKTQVEIKLTLGIESEGKDKEETEGAAYWLLQPFLEQFTEMRFGNGCCILDSFDIEIIEEDGQ